MSELDRRRLVADGKIIEPLTEVTYPGHDIEPLVCAVMLTKDRPEMARMAVECFRDQTYGNKNLLVLDTGNNPDDGHRYMEYSRVESERLLWNPNSRDSIGRLRNIAGEQALVADILIHWDDDDWSHPNRIAEQVAFLQHSGADAVGYRQMLFWRTDPGEAWVYSNPHPRYCLGTSLCYWRSAWERNPFPDTSKGEEGQPLVGWQSKLKCASETAVFYEARDHRMIASIHGGNTCSAIDTNSPFWKRAPEFDEYCRERMAL